MSRSEREKSGASLVDAFDSILKTLRAATNSSRTTVRLDVPELNFEVNSAIAEARATNVQSILGETSIDQWSLPTVRYLKEQRKMLVQPDCLVALLSPPKILIEVYGVRAQILHPVFWKGEVIGWVSVHQTGEPREWTEADVEAVRHAVEAIEGELETTAVGKS